MDFANVTGDSDSAWLSAGIAETVTGDLRDIGRFRVVDRARVVEAVRRTDGSLHAVSADLGTTFAVVGSYQRSCAIASASPARIVNVENGEALADAKVDGPACRHLRVCRIRWSLNSRRSSALSATSSAERRFARDAKPRGVPRVHGGLAAVSKRSTCARFHQAIASFERAIAIDPRYALAYTGLASAQLAAYEATRSDNEPAKELLDAAIGHARQGRRSR